MFFYSSCRWFYRSVKISGFCRTLWVLLPIGNAMPLLTSEDLGHAIRARRRELGITQRQLSLTAGTGMRFIVDLENGKPTAQIGKALAVLQSLGLALDLSPRGSSGTKRP